MKIAWNEIKYQPKKFILIELLITILMFMVVFLSGLTNGLGRSVSAQIDNYGSLHYILSTDSEGIIPFSTITEKDLDEVQKIEGMDYSGLSIQRATVSKSEDSNTLDITYFATDHNEEEILNPIIDDADLKISDLKKNEVILDSSFKEDEGIQVGDHVIDKTSKNSRSWPSRKMLNTVIARLALSARIPTQACGKKQIQAINGKPKPL